mgnify:CR=1 FL=1
MPESDGLALSEPPLTTPYLSVVAFDGGLTLKLEPNRFQVTASGEATPDSDATVERIAVRFIQALPHMRYLAVGNNFQRFLAVDDAVAFVRERFIKSGPWLSPDSRTVGISFGYDLDDGLLTLSFDSEFLLEENGDEICQLAGVGIKANFHRDCTEYPADRQAGAQVGKLPEDRTLLSERLGQLLDGRADT